jgi:hypothetical protein
VAAADIAQFAKLNACLAQQRSRRFILRSG